VFNRKEVVAYSWFVYVLPYITMCSFVIRPMSH